MKPLVLALPLLLLAASATRPAAFERFTVELRAVEFDWPLAKDAPASRMPDEAVMRSVAQAALGPTAKETWNISTTAQSAVPFTCTVA